MKTTNYFNTFIEVADDCPVTAAEVPPQKGAEPTVASIQYEMLTSAPYEHTSDDVIFNAPPATLRHRNSGSRNVRI
jgi:hypothetical protein